MTTQDSYPEFVTLDEGGAVFRIQEGVYGKEAIAAALHRFTDRCSVHMERSEADWVTCRIVRTREDEDLRGLAHALANELLDQMLRQHLKQETEPIRRLLLAQAFSHTNILHPELDESEAWADPLSISNPDPPFRRE